MKKLILLCLVALTASCDDSSSVRGDGSTNEAINVQLTTDRHPKYLETATLTCRYEVQYEMPSSVGGDEFVVNGHFGFPSTHFAAVAGESTWVDTVLAHTPRTHSVTVRALKRGDWLVDALTSSVVVDSISIIGGSDSIELHVE